MLSAQRRLSDARSNGTKPVCSTPRQPKRAISHERSHRPSARRAEWHCKGSTGMRHCSGAAHARPTSSHTDATREPGSSRMALPQYSRGDRRSAEPQSGRTTKERGASASAYRQKRHFHPLRARKRFLRKAGRSHCFRPDRNSVAKMIGFEPAHYS